MMMMIMTMVVVVIMLMMTAGCRIINTLEQRRIPLLPREQRRKRVGYEMSQTHNPEKKTPVSLLCPVHYHFTTSRSSCSESLPMQTYSARNSLILVPLGFIPILQNRLPSIQVPFGLVFK